MNWACFFGNHKWVAIHRASCKMYKGNLFGHVVRNIPGEITWERCSVCGEKRCYATDGEDTKTLNFGFMARKYGVNES